MGGMRALSESKSATGRSGHAVLPAVPVDVQVVRGHVLDFAQCQEGSRVVQDAFERSPQDVRVELAGELMGHVLETSRSKHGNYVVAAVVALLTPQQAAFIAAEVSKDTVDAAKHRFACRIVCRLLEFATNQEHCIGIADEIADNAVALSIHPFANYVVSTCFEHAGTRRRRRILEAIRAELSACMESRNGRRVIEYCLRYATAEDGVATIFFELLRVPAHSAGKIKTDALMRVCTKPGLAHCVVPDYRKDI